MTPNKKLPARPEQTAKERVEESRSFLLAHGFINQKEYQSIGRRIWLWTKRKSDTERF